MVQAILLNADPLIARHMLLTHILHHLIVSHSVSVISCIHVLRDLILFFPHPRKQPKQTWPLSHDKDPWIWVNGGSMFSFPILYEDATSPCSRAQNERNMEILHITWVPLSKSASWLRAFSGTVWGTGRNSATRCTYSTHSSVYCGTGTPIDSQLLPGCIEACMLIGYIRRKAKCADMMVS